MDNNRQGVNSLSIVGRLCPISEVPLYLGCKAYGQMTVP